MPEGSANVARFLPQTADSTPTALALRAPAGRKADGLLTYVDKSFAALEHESTQTAHLLTAGGLRRGCRTLLLVKPGLNLIRITFALFKIGAVPVVIDPGMGLRNFLACVKHIQPEFLIGIPQALVLRHLFRRKFSTVKHSFAITGAFERRLAGFADKRYPTVATAQDELAAILFTSGSTGPPKGVCYSHGIFDAQVSLISERFQIQAGEIDLPMLPIFALFNPALGMTTIVPEMNPSRPASVDPANIVRAIQQNGVTNSFGSPVLWAKIGRYCTARDIRLPSLRRILVAGAPVAPDVIRMLLPLMPKGMLYTPYGATEALPLTSLSGSEILNQTWEKTEKGAGTCVGYPFKSIRIKIIPINDEPILRLAEGDTLPNGSIGEIIASGPVVTPSYYAAPDATAAAKITDRDGGLWHRMGDIGYLDDEGRLWFCGRKAERVICGDKVYYTDCCEAVFNTHPDVFRTALIGAKNGDETRPALMVEPEAGKFPRSAKEKRQLAESLYTLGRSHAHTRSIHTFAFSRSFPVDVRHNAKIHRLTLAKRFRWKHAVQLAIK